MHAATLLQPLKTKHCGSVHYIHYIKVGDSRLRTVASAAGLWGRSPLYLIGDTASRRGLCAGRVFHPS